MASSWWWSGKDVDRCHRKHHFWIHYRLLNHLDFPTWKNVTVWELNNSHFLRTKLQHFKRQRYRTQISPSLLRFFRVFEYKTIERMARKVAHDGIYGSLGESILFYHMIAIDWFRCYSKRAFRSWCYSDCLCDVAPDSHLVKTACIFTLEILGSDNKSTRSFQSTWII